MGIGREAFQFLLIFGRGKGSGKKKRCACFLCRQHIDGDPATLRQPADITDAVGALGSGRVIKLVKLAENSSVINCCTALAAIGPGAVL